MIRRVRLRWKLPWTVEVCLSGTRGCRFSPFGILEQMEGYALELSCLALRRVWGAVLGDFIWHGFFVRGWGDRTVWARRGC